MWGLRKVLHTVLVVATFKNKTFHKVTSFLVLTKSLVKSQAYLHNNELHAKDFVFCTSSICDICKLMQLWRIDFLKYEEDTSMFSVVLRNHSNGKARWFQTQWQPSQSTFWVTRLFWSLWDWETSLHVNQGKHHTIAASHIGDRDQTSRIVPPCVEHCQKGKQQRALLKPVRENTSSCTVFQARICSLLLQS